MQLKEFKPYSFIKACKKFHYSFHRVEVEPIDPLKGDIQIEADAASYNLTFWIIHGFFGLRGTVVLLVFIFVT